MLRIATVGFVIAFAFIAVTNCFSLSLPASLSLLKRSQSHRNSHRNSEQPAGYHHCQRINQRSKGVQLLSKPHWYCRTLNKLQCISDGRDSIDTCNSSLCCHLGIVIHRWSRSLVTYLVASVFLYTMPTTVMASSPETTARELVMKGMDAYRRGQLAVSMADFNEAMTLDESIGDRLWQRGLALYDSDDFAGCALQFRRDVRDNPADMEEKLWALLCDARGANTDIASLRDQLIAAPIKDPRPYMRIIYDVFAGTTTPTKALERASDTPASYFYINLYMALYYDVNGETSLASNCIKQAMQSPYALQSSDYMISVGKYENRRLHSI